MPEELKNVYQSGQQVFIAGTYEVVGADSNQTVSKPQNATCELRLGNLFPDYKGWEVSWRLISKAPQEAKARSGS